MSVIGFKVEKTKQEIHVKAAHELASKLVKVIYDNYRQDFYDEFNRKPINSIFYLFKLILSKIDFDLYITWDLEREYLGDNNIHRNRIVPIVNACEDIIIANRLYFSNPDFIERFIHLFFNCMLLGSVYILGNTTKNGEKVFSSFETVFWKHFNKHNALQSISNSINGGG